MALAAADMNSDVSNHTRLQCKGADEGLTIAEVSRQYDISADTLRYYERMGLLPHVGRTSAIIPRMTAIGWSISSACAVQGFLWRHCWNM